MCLGRGRFMFFGAFIISMSFLATFVACQCYWLGSSCYRLFRRKGLVSFMFLWRYKVLVEESLYFIG
jgi:hypothetical protein